MCFLWLLFFLRSTYAWLWFYTAYKKNTVICSAHKTHPSSYKDSHMAASHGCFVLKKRFLLYEQATRALRWNSMCYCNPLGSSKTCVEVQKKLNTLKNPGEQNPLVCKWHGQNVYQLVIQVLIHRHLHTLWCESDSNIVFNHQLHNQPKGML